MPTITYLLALIKSSDPAPRSGSLQTGQRSRAITPYGRVFLGEFYPYDTYSGTTLSLTGLTDGSITISFDLYVMGSWNGNGNYCDYEDCFGGPHIWDLSVDPPPVNTPDQPQLLHTTFSNYEASDQAYPGTYPESSYPGHFGAVEIGTLGYRYHTYTDSVYHLTYTFPHSGPELRFNFAAAALSLYGGYLIWGLDNVEVKLDNTTIYSNDFESDILPPANDAFASATLISSLPFNDSILTLKATTASSDPSPCPPNTKSVWYKVTPSKDGTILADTSGSYDAMISVWTRSSKGALTQVGSCGEQVSFTALAGTTYYFMVTDGNNIGGILNFYVNQGVSPKVIINDKGTVDWQTGIATVSGTVQCIEGQFRFYGYHRLSQRLGGKTGQIVTGYANPSYGYQACGDGPMPWSLQFRPDLYGVGFATGQAKVTVTISAYGLYDSVENLETTKEINLQQQKK